MKQSILVMPAGCLISGPTGPSGSPGAPGEPGAPGAAGARGAAECVGEISEGEVIGAFVGPGQLLFFGPTNSVPYGWANDPASLTTPILMALVTEVVDPLAVPVRYRLKVLTVSGVSWRTVSVPMQYVLDTVNLSLWLWVDSYLADPEGTPHYVLKAGVYTGNCGGISLHAATVAGGELLCVSEISA